MSRMYGFVWTSFALLALAACSHGSTGTSAPPPAPAPVAQAAPSSPPPMDMATRLQTMHDQLGITPTQEPIWNRFGNSLLSASSKITAMQDAKAQNGQSMTVIQGMKAQQDMLTAQMASMHQLMPAAQQLYSSMTPDQQAKWSDMMRAHDGPTCGYDCYLLHHY